MILPIHHIFYIETLMYDIGSIDICINNINQELLLFEDHQINDPNSFFEIDKTLNLLQDFVYHVGNISKMFWPIRQQNVFIERGNELRILFEIDDESPLRNRELRNTLEHFDERLDQYLCNFPTGIIYPKYIGPSNDENDLIHHYFRAYFTDKYEFQILDTKIEINPIIEEVNKLKRVMQKKLDKNFNIISNRKR